MTTIKIKAILSDFSNTLLFPVNREYRGSLNALYNQLKDTGEFDFWQHFSWNGHLYSQYQQFKLKGIKLYIFTTGGIQADKALTEKMQLFDSVFTVASIDGLEKETPQAYLEIAQRIQTDPQEILFIDDTQANIDAASKAGLSTKLYKSELIVLSPK